MFIRFVHPRVSTKIQTSQQFHGCYEFLKDIGIMKGAKMLSARANKEQTTTHKLLEKWNYY